MKRSIILSLSLISALAGMGQTFTVPISEPKHLNLDSLVRKAAPLTDGDKSRAMAIVAGKVGHASYKLDERCGLTAADGKKSLSDLGMTAADAKDAYPDTWRWLTSEKLPTGANRWGTSQADATIVKLSKFDACRSDAFWVNGIYIPLAGSRGILLSNNDIQTPHGAYWLTMQADLGYGMESGSGNFNSSDQSGLGGTELHMWHERWQGDPVNRTLMGAFHGGSDNFFAYSEGQQVHNIRFNGEAKSLKDPVMNITGLQIWDSGEGCDYGNLFAHHCDIGIDNVRGTPTTFSGTISCFSNNEAGLAFTGGAGATGSAATISLDDNGKGIHVRAGWGRPAGIALNIGAIKAEACITPGRPYKPNTLVFEGWCRVKIGVLSFAANAYLTDMIDAKCDINTSHIQIDDIRGGGSGRPMQNILWDRVNGKSWPFDNSWTSTTIGLDWYSYGGGTMTTKPVQVSSFSRPNIVGRMGYLVGDPVTGQPVGSFNYTTGSPAWSDVTGNGAAGTSTPCTGWTTGAWGACVGGTQTRTVTATPTGCVGTPANKPASSQTCTVVPPGTPQTINNATSATKVPCTLPLVKSITYTGLKFNALAANAFGGYLNDNVYCGYNGLYRDQNVLVKAFQQGVSANATVTFAQPVALKWAVGHLDSQTGANWTATKVVLTP